MKVLLRNVTIIDRNSTHHLQKSDIYVQDGIIEKIEPDLSKLVQKDVRIIDGTDSYISQGWVDIFAHFADPGMEFKETLESGAQAAFCGGFSSVFVVPNTKPVLDNKAQINYIKSSSKQLPVEVYPIGSITQKSEGHDLAEMYDMHQAGAIAFSDGLHPVQSPGLFLKALQYVKAFDGVLIQLPFDTSIGTYGLINEGIVSTRLGLPGLPAISEELMISRDIELLRYADSRLHITGVSSAKSIELIREAKNEGLQITCSVTAYHLLYTDEDLQGYDTNLKLNPPLRTIQDRDALRAAVMDGTIDVIASHHFPQHSDDKVVEFETAKSGMINLQTSYGALQEALPALSPQKVVELLVDHPKSIFGLAFHKIEQGEIADLTLFNPTGVTEFNQMVNKSRSQNSPFFDKALKGKVIACLSKNNIHIND